MRFIDSDVFLYAAIKPRRKPSEKILDRKEKAKSIISRIEEGEKVVTTVVHLGEIANILEAKVDLSMAIEFLKDLCWRRTLKYWGCRKRIFSELCS